MSTKQKKSPCPDFGTEISNSIHRQQCLARNLKMVLDNRRQSGGTKLMNDIASKWRHEVKTLRRYIDVKEKEQSGGDPWQPLDMIDPANRAKAALRVEEIIARENSNLLIVQAMEGPLNVIYNQLAMFLQTSATDKKTIDDYEKRNGVYAEKIKSLNGELIKAKTDLDTIQKKLIAAESTHGEIGSNQAKLLDELNSQLLLKDGKIKDLESNFASKLQEIEALNAKINKHNDEMKKEREDCENRDAKLAADLTILKKQLDAESAKHVEELVKFKSENGGNNVGTEALNKQFNEKNTEYQTKIAKLEGEILANNAEKVELQKKFSEQTTELEKLRKTLADNEAKYQSDISAVRAASQEEIAKLRAEKENNRKASQSSDDIAFIKNTDELERVTLELNELKKERKDFEDELNIKSEEIQKLSAEKEQANRKISQLNKDNQDMNKSFNEVMTNLDKLQKPFAERPDYKILEESAKKAVLRLIELAKSFDQYSPEKVIGTMKTYSVWADQEIITTLINMAQKEYQTDIKFKNSVQMVDSVTNIARTAIAKKQWNDLKRTLTNAQCSSGLFCYILKLSIINRILEKIINPNDKDLQPLLKIISETEI